MIATRRRRAFVLADAIMGISIMVLLSGIAAVAMFSRATAGKRLEDLRAATAEAELVLSELQAGQPTNIPGTSKEVRLEYPSGGAVIPGDKWVRVVVTRGGESASLAGLEQKNNHG